MDFSCDRCGRRFFVPDDLVQGRAFRARCAECGHAFEVSPTEPALAAAPAAGLPRKVKIALSDEELAALVARAAPSDAPGVTAPGHARPVSAPAAALPPPEPAPALRSLGRITPRPAQRAPEANPSRVPAAAALEADGATDEYELAAGTRHRHRGALLAAGGVAAACAVAVVAVRLAGRAPERTVAPAPAAAPAAAASVAAPAPGDDPQPAPAAAEPAPAPPRAGTPPPRRSKIGRRDRKLLDLLARKEDVRMAPPEEVALDSARSALDPAAVERTIAANRRAFDACVTRALRLDPGLRVSKRATLVVTVEPRGRVSGAWIAEEQLQASDLGRCLVTASSRMSFPSFEGEAIDVSIPLSLSTIQ